MAPAITAAPVIHTIKIAVEAPTIVVVSIVVARMFPTVAVGAARMLPTMAVGAARMFPTVAVADDVGNRLIYRTEQWVRADADV